MTFPCQRPKEMTPGTIPIVTNLLAVKSKPVCYSYLVTFTPELKRDLHPLFMRVTSETLTGVLFAFDGTNTLITKTKINDLELKFMLGKEKEFLLKIVFKHSSTEEALQIPMFETIIRQHQQMKFMSEGRRSFDKRDAHTLAGGIEIYGGLAHSIKSTNLGMFLNLDAAFNVFIQARSLISLLNLYHKEETRQMGAQLPNMQSEFWNKASIFLKNCQVETLHTNFAKKFKIFGLLTKSAKQILFMKEDKEVSVAEYFEQTYGKLEYPDLPVAVVKKQGKETYFPIEVLKVCDNQKYTKKLNETQTADMLKYAAKIPIDRFSFIKEKINVLEMTNNSVLKDFNLVIDSNFQECKGRLLKSPKIIFGKGKEVQSDQGKFSLIGVEAYRNVQIKKIAVATLSNVDKHTIQSNFETLLSFASKFNLKLPATFTVSHIKSDMDFAPFLESSGADLVFVILPSKSSEVYNKVKRIAETTVGVITQCIQQKNIQKLSNITFAYNILIKINIKTGGANLVMNNEILSRPTMIIGADISHPGVGDLEAPSIVGVVTSVDSKLTKYKTFISTQPRRTEIIENLKTMIVNGLHAFHKHNKINPEKIIYFRDGVGDSQFYALFETEHKAIREACSSFSPNYNPQLTVIVVQKRHSLRFLLGYSSSGLKGGDNLIKRIENVSLGGLKGGFRDRPPYQDKPPYQDRAPYKDGYQKRDNYGKRERSNEDRSGNVLPGTIVEEIGHPYYYDFYLVSQFALQGTARPTRYQILVNESNYPIKELQEFIHNLCYLFQRANKAISEPAPVRFAHLAALRAKAYLERKGDVVDFKAPVEWLSDYLYYL